MKMDRTMSFLIPQCSVEGNHGGLPPYNWRDP